MAVLQVDRVVGGLHTVPGWWRGTLGGYTSLWVGSIFDLTGVHDCVTGGPGSGRAAHSTRLVERYPGWLHLSMGGIYL